MKSNTFYGHKWTPQPHTIHNIHDIHNTQYDIHNIHNIYKIHNIHTIHTMHNIHDIHNTQYIRYTQYTICTIYTIHNIQCTMYTIYTIYTIWTSGVRYTQYTRCTQCIRYTQYTQYAQYTQYKQYTQYTQYKQYKQYTRILTADKWNPTLSMGTNELHNRLEGMTSKVNYVGSFGRVIFSLRGSLGVTMTQFWMPQVSILMSQGHPGTIWRDFQNHWICIVKSTIWASGGRWFTAGSSRGYLSSSGHLFSFKKASLSFEELCRFRMFSACKPLMSISSRFYDTPEIL